MNDKVKQVGKWGLIGFLVWQASQLVVGVFVVAPYFYHQIMEARQVETTSALACSDTVVDTGDTF